jgi:hypothetical protein
MINLGRYSISAKIYMVIAVLSVVTIAITTVSVISLNHMTSAVEEIDVSASEIRNGSEISRLAVELSRAEYEVA